MRPSDCIGATVLRRGQGSLSRKSFVSLSVLVAALVALVLTESASAAQITYQSVTGIWHDPMDNVPGSQPGDPVITNGNPTSIVRWGTTNGSQSGYDYTATVPPPFTLPGPIPFFSLGTFTHRNFEVSDPSLTSVQLDVVLVLAVDGVPTGPLTFTFTFNHEETPNNANPCPYPTPPGEGCTDRVTIVASPQPTTFNVGGVDYTLAMNFLVNGQPVNEYITREGGTTNSSGLVGEFILPPGTPALTVEKSGPATMNPAEWGNFVIDVRNVGDVDAFDATLVDRLPDGPTGGMCDTTPQVLSARVFAADGVTPVAGKGPLTQGTDYSLAYNGTACQLTLNTLTAASVIGATQRLIVAYRTQLDSNTQYNAALTNVAGTTEWSNGPDTNPTRVVYTRTLTNGTVGIVDHEDAHTVTIVPRLYAEKSAALQVDAMSPGIVDPGDVLRYTIRIYNNGTLPITQAVLRDSVPANTTYVADSMTLNAQPLGSPDGGVSPLVAGVDVSSSNLTPPSPSAGAGTLSPGQSAVATFDLRVNDGVPPGTVIVNQAVVDTAELPNLLTDGDGNPATGPEPTVVVVGNLQELRITKNVSVVGDGPAIAGATLEYVVQVTNAGVLPAYAVVIRDDIAVPMPGYLTFVDQSWSLNGSTNGIAVVGSLLTADYSTTYGALQPGRAITLRFRAVLDPNLAMGTRVTNTATVYWNDPAQQASASVSIDVGGVTGVGILSGSAWHDANFDNLRDANERPLEGWTVELYRNDELVHTALTDADGVYRISGVAPNYLTMEAYVLKFRAPGAGPSTALLGRAYSMNFTNGLQQISDIVIAPGNNLLNLDLPIDPNGVVYDSVARTPIAGAILSLEQPGGGALPSSCFDDPAQQNQVTLASGYYKFDINFSDPACASGGSYLVRVTAPTAAYIAGYSDMIPPTSDDSTAPFSVPACPGSIDDVVVATRGALRGASVRIRSCCVDSESRRRNDLPRASVARRGRRAGLEPDLQQPHPARPRLERCGRHREDDEPVQRRTRPDGAVHDHGQQHLRREPRRVAARGPLPARIPLRGRLRTSRRRRGRADAGWSRVGVELRYRCVGSPHAAAIAGGRRRCERGRVRESRAGDERVDRQRRVRRGVREGPADSRSDVRLHGRDGQGLRRHQSQRRAGRWRGGLGGYSSRNGARPRRPDGRVRPIPRHVCDHTPRGPRQQLRLEARRPNAAERVQAVDRGRPSATRDAR